MTKRKIARSKLSTKRGRRPIAASTARKAKRAAPKAPAVRDEFRVYRATPAGQRLTAELIRTCEALGIAEAAARVEARREPGDYFVMVDDGLMDKGQGEVQVFEIDSTPKPEARPFPDPVWQYLTPRVLEEMLDLVEADLAEAREELISSESRNANRHRYILSALASIQHAMFNIEDLRGRTEKTSVAEEATVTA